MKVVFVELFEIGRYSVGLGRGIKSSVNGKMLMGIWIWREREESRIRRQR